VNSYFSFELPICWFPLLYFVLTGPFCTRNQIADFPYTAQQTTGTATMAPNSHIEVEGLPIYRSAGFHQKVVDGIEDLMLVLAEDSRVLYASPKSFSLIQVKPEALLGQHISTYMKVDDIPVFLIDFKENMASGTSWRSHHRLRRADDTYKPFESTFKPYTDIAVDDKTGSKTSTKMCLMTARPYQIASTSLMDSYLEHYTTNIRLTKQLARLKREAEDYYRDTVSTPTAQRATSRIDTTTRIIEVSIFQKLHLIASRLR
jgi:hypothetical protein